MKTSKTESEAKKRGRIQARLIAEEMRNVAGGMASKGSTGTCECDSSPISEASTNETTSDPGTDDAL